MVGRSFCSLKQFINEEIHPREAANIKDSIQTVIDGKREVGYGLFFDEDLKTLKLNNISYFRVPRSDNWEYYIFYTNKDKALRLLDIAKNHDGKLSDMNPEEAIEIGKLLGYYDDDIDHYVFKKYNQHYKPYKMKTIEYPDLDNIHDE